MSNNQDKPEVDEIDCIEAFDHIYAYINGELTDQTSLSHIEHHLSHCKSCYSRAQMERKLNERMQESDKVKTPDSLQNRLNNLIDDF